ncbi:hypothetical protein CKO51_14010 [Rhodopirellula sp. SM50]|nr:hypothetical protein CKO51_14010 [Rhodopirellula sp. SM50]
MMQASTTQPAARSTTRQRFVATRSKSPAAFAARSRSLDPFAFAGAVRVRWSRSRSLEPFGA